MPKVTKKATISHTLARPLYSQISATSPAAPLNVRDVAIITIFHWDGSFQVGYEFDWLKHEKLLLISSFSSSICTKMKDDIKACLSAISLSSANTVCKCSHLHRVHGSYYSPNF